MLFRSQEQNVSSLARELGVSSHTIESWISILASSYLTFSLEPFHANLGKRLIKRPKLYFWDTGLACYLSGIRDQEALEGGPLYGPFFENLVVAELRKKAIHNGLDQDFRFYRDNSGLEVDLIISDKTTHSIRIIEIKTGHTAKVDWAQRLLSVSQLLKSTLAFDWSTILCQVIYQGETKLSWPKPGVDFLNVSEVLSY